MGIYAIMIAANVNNVTAQEVEAAVGGVSESAHVQLLDGWAVVDPYEKLTVNISSHLEVLEALEAVTGSEALITGDEFWGAHDDDEGLLREMIDAFKSGAGYWQTSGQLRDYLRHREEVEAKWRRVVALALRGRFLYGEEDELYVSVDRALKDLYEIANAEWPRYPRVFISYSHPDRHFVERLGRALQRKGVRTWVDYNELRVGDSLIHRISDGIEESRYVVAVLSTASVDSEWVRKELEIAMTDELELGHVRVLPILVDDCRVPAFLRGKMYLDFRPSADFDAGCQALIERLKESQLPTIPLRTKGREHGSLDDIS